MNKNLIIALLGICPLLSMAQGATDAYQLSQTDLKGTARFMSMAGAFGALGGDISTLNQNPAGIGIYRNSDIGITLDFNNLSTASKGLNVESGNINQFKFTCNSAGYVGAYKLNSDIMPNFNWGFSYNRAASFNRHYTGRFGRIGTSLSNYIADVTNNTGYNDSELAESPNYDPYQESNAPWLSILSYNSYMINPNSQGVDFKGLYGDKTTGSGEFEVQETGGINEYSINFGGNFVNKLYWGIGFGITDINYTAYSYYGETLKDGVIAKKDDKGTMIGNANYGLSNNLHTSGSGYNYKLGLIFKPINELRFGFAFHSPTYYSLKDEAYANVSYEYSSGNSGLRETNNGWLGESWYKISTPWKFIASAATVIGGRGILSFDYEYVGYQTMTMSSNQGVQYNDVKENIRNYYKAANIFRIGGEFRVNKAISVRAGYSYQTSPVTDNAYNNDINITTSGTMPAYSFDKSISYITCGAGYRYKWLYVDLAYAHKNRKSEYHAFSSIGKTDTPIATIEDNNNQIVATVGFRF